MDKGALLDRLGAAGEERLLLAKVLDRAVKAQKRNAFAATDFLSPAERLRAEELLRLGGFSKTDYATFGGYPEAERRILLFLPRWMEREDADGESPIRCLRVSFREEDGLSHRDFLGSLMGLGIVREKIGDILVSPASADVVVLESVAEFLLQNWDCAGRAKLTAALIPPEELRVPQGRFQEIRETVSSLRLDAVTAAGFRLSRGRAAELIASGRVQVNWREWAKGDKPLAAGDTVSARGLGKFQLSEVGKTTRKGRISVVIKRYV